MLTYTAPEVLTTGVQQGWADEEKDPTQIDWAARQAAAAIPFEVVDGRPINPCERTAVRYGRNQMGHWGEAQAADAVVTAVTADGQRWLLLVERADGLGWALPGGMTDPGENPYATAERELFEETGLRLPGWMLRHHGRPRYVPDPRASDEAWIVTRPMYVELDGFADEAALPPLTVSDETPEVMWLPADSYLELTCELNLMCAGARVFPAHDELLREVLDGPGEDDRHLDEIVNGQLADADHEQLHVWAGDYLRLTAALQISMGDMTPWGGGGEPDLVQLRRYVEHVTGASHGGCSACGQAIMAADPFVDLPRLPFWHPRRWLNVLIDCWRAVRYSGYRSAHVSCVNRNR